MWENCFWHPRAASALPDLYCLTSVVQINTKVRCQFKINFYFLYLLIQSYILKTKNIWWCFWAKGLDCTSAISCRTDLLLWTFWNTIIVLAIISHTSVKWVKYFTVSYNKSVLQWQRNIARFGHSSSWIKCFVVMASKCRQWLCCATNKLNDIVKRVGPFSLKWHTGS